MSGQVEMRVVLAQELEKIMEANHQVCVIDADLAKANGTYPLREKFPERAFDVGVAEQNMAGVAAGLSSYGFIPFIASFTPFASRRICDQIAVSIAYAKQNVKIIGSDPGISAELNGGTHMSVEDVGVLRSIPGLVIFEPCDAIQLKKSLPEIVAHDGPVYIRLFRKVAPAIFDEAYSFDLFRADVMTEGNDVTICAGGIMLDMALKAAESLRENGISAEILNVHTIKPLDEETILASARKTGCLVSCENHNVVGGLYSAISELLCAKLPIPAEAVGIQDRFGQVATMPWLTQEYSMTAEDVAAVCKRVIERKRAT